MPNNLRLDRKQLASLFNNNHQAIVAFERVLGDTFVLPTTIEEAAAQATQALAVATQALSMVQSLFEALEAAEGAPAAFAPDLPDDTAPRVQLGTMASQSADAVQVGTLSAEGQITSTVANGTAPFVVASTTRVNNLRAANSDFADKMTNPTTFADEAVSPETTMALVNQLRSAAILKGL